jgi:arabinofuranosyltransferase
VSSTGFRAPQRWNLILVAAASLTLLLTARAYLPLVVDDALISFRYSERLLLGKGLTFTDGERVEGYSNLLWVLVVAAGGLISRDLILVARVAGAITMCLAIAAFVPVLRGLTARETDAPATPIATLAAVMPALAALSLVALSHGPAIWAIGGLEQGLQSALLMWAIALIIMTPPEVAPRVDESRVSAGIMLALLVWTRPDGALFAALGALALFVVHAVSLASLRDTIRGIARLVVLPAAAWLGQLAFRLAYYGDWLPNTAYAKVSPSWEHAIAGLHYMGGGLWKHAAIVAVVSVGLICARPFRRREILVPLFMAIGWSAYVVTIGGDFFPGRRHFLPVLWCLAVLVAVTWRGAVGRLPLVAQLAVFVLLVSVHGYQQRTDRANTVAHDERWEWDCGLVSASLGKAFDERQPLVAADALGCVGYFSKLPMLDMLGLTDRYLAHHRPADFGRRDIGHELGDGRYVLSRSPAIVVTCVPGQSRGACFRSGIEMLALPEFHQRYVLVAIRTQELLYHSHLWFDVTSSRLGTVRTEREIRLPGFLFGGPDTGYAMRSGDRRFVARLSTDAVVTLDKPALFEPLADGGASTSSKWTVRAIASQPMEASIDGTTIRIKTGPNGGELKEVVLTR